MMSRPFLSRLSVAFSARGDSLYSYLVEVDEPTGDAMSGQRPLCLFTIGRAWR